MKPEEEKFFLLCKHRNEENLKEYNEDPEVIKNLLFLIFVDFIYQGSMKQFKNSRKLFADPIKFYKFNNKQE